MVPIQDYSKFSHCFSIVNEPDDIKPITKEDFDQGLEFLSQNKFKEAVKKFEFFLKSDPICISALINYGVCLSYLGKILEAMEAINCSLGIKQTAEAWNNKGVYLVPLGG